MKVDLEDTKVDTRALAAICDTKVSNISAVIQLRPVVSDLSKAIFFEQVVLFKLSIFRTLPSRPAFRCLHCRTQRGDGQLCQPAQPGSSALKFIIATLAWRRGRHEETDKHDFGHYSYF